MCAGLEVLLIEGYADIEVLSAWVSIQPKAGEQVREESNEASVAPAVVPQVWQLEVPFLFFEVAEHENSCG